MLVLVAAGVSACAPQFRLRRAANPFLRFVAGDYARQIRKEPGAKSTPKVFDNDNLPREDKLSVVGRKPAPASERVHPEPDGISTRTTRVPHLSVASSRMSRQLGVDHGAGGQGLVELHVADDVAQVGLGQLGDGQHEVGHVVDEPAGSVAS